MKHFISNRNPNKKTQRAENAKRRTMWAISPTTRVKQSKKIYNRKKIKGDDY
jgi:hypothetical protein